jgi:hypothetical protein
MVEGEKRGMITIKYDATRDREKGQFFISLHAYREPSDPVEKWDRLGYWCDEPHLQATILSLQAALIQKDKIQAGILSELLRELYHYSNDGDAGPGMPTLPTRDLKLRGKITGWLKRLGERV